MSIPTVKNLAGHIKFALSRNSKSNMAGVNPKLVAIVERAIQITKMDFGIPSLGGLRTAEEQHKLFLDGKSTLDGYKKKSNHQSGNAIDVFAFYNGKASWDEYHLALVCCAMMQAASELKIGLRWGGHWNNFVDMPHFELINP